MPTVKTTRPMTVIEALVLSRAGWGNERERLVFDEANGVLRRAYLQLLDERIPKPDELPPPKWIP